ncbi:hypothetical protein RRG08_033752 [Elysia crispata]|uniref:Uncharacterized protein n=1 Tax=Elysia crispata TaxID=231223 RepID=A0AAE1E3C2_9GAST|nr:hypothetical protein RRG08_033752 [Elysia crispata]
MVKQLFTVTDVLYELAMDNNRDGKGTEISFCSDDSKGFKNSNLEISSTYRRDDENLDLPFTLPEGD